MGWRVGMGMAGITPEGSKGRSLQHPGTLPQALSRASSFPSKGDTQVSLLWAPRQHLQSHVRN